MKKRKNIAILLWFFGLFGYLNLHNFYLKRNKKAAIRLILFLFLSMRATLDTDALYLLYLIYFFIALCLFLYNVVDLIELFRLSSDAEGFIQPPSTTKPSSVKKKFLTTVVIIGLSTGIVTPMFFTHLKSQEAAQAVQEDLSPVIPSIFSQDDAHELFGITFLLSSDGLITEGLNIKDFVPTNPQAGCFFAVQTNDSQLGVNGSGIFNISDLDHDTLKKYSIRLQDQQETVCDLFRPGQYYKGTPFTFTEDPNEARFLFLYSVQYPQGELYGTLGVDTVRGYNLSVRLQVFDLTTGAFVGDAWYLKTLGKKVSVSSGTSSTWPSLSADSSEYNSVKNGIGRNILPAILALEEAEEMDSDSLE